MKTTFPIMLNENISLIVDCKIYKSVGSSGMPDWDQEEAKTVGMQQICVPVTQ